MLEHVAEWLAQNQQLYLSKPASFAVPVSAAAALDGAFASRMAASLSRHSLDDGLVMLIVPAQAWSAQPEALQPLLELCDQLGCRVVLDDFELNEAALLLLRSRAVRMLKLSAELTAEAMRERFPRALLSACTHIARVLGIHCIAKRVESAAAGRWLAVAGVDYLDPFSPSETASATTIDEASGVAAGFVALGRRARRRRDAPVPVRVVTRAFRRRRPVGFRGGLLLAGIGFFAGIDVFFQLEAGHVESLQQERRGLEQMPA